MRRKDADPNEPMRTKVFTIRMHEKEFLQFKEYCHSEYKSMAHVGYELIRNHLAKVSDGEKTKSKTKKKT